MQFDLCHHEKSDLISDLNYLHTQLGIFSPLIDSKGSPNLSKTNNKLQVCHAALVMQSYYSFYNTLGSFSETGCFLFHSLSVIITLSLWSIFDSHHHRLVLRRFNSKIQSYLIDVESHASCAVALITSHTIFLTLTSCSNLKYRKERFKAICLQIQLFVLKTQLFVFNVSCLF